MVDWQSERDLDSIRNSCDVLHPSFARSWRCCTTCPLKRAKPRRWERALRQVPDTSIRGIGGPGSSTEAALLGACQNNELYNWCNNYCRRAVCASVTQLWKPVQLIIIATKIFQRHQVQAIKHKLQKSINRSSNKLNGFQQEDVLKVKEMEDLYSRLQCSQHDTQQ